MATRSLPCPFPDCTFQTEDLEPTGAAISLQIHGYSHAAPATAPPPPPTAPRAPPTPKLDRPRIDTNVTGEEWNAFSRRWDAFKSGSNITDNTATPQLFACASQRLGDIVLRAIPDFTTKPINDAIESLKTLAVVPVAIGVVRSELSAMKQDDETFRVFAAAVQGKAETCEFRTKNTGTCTNCNTPYVGETYYTDERIRDVLLDGIADLDIRREALSTDNIQSKSINDVITFVESRETARNANTAQSLSAMSSRRRQPNDSQRAHHNDSASRQNHVPSQADQARTAPCPDCGNMFNLFTRSRRGWNRAAHERCTECWRRARGNRQQQQQQQQQPQQNGDHSVIECDQFGQVSGIDVNSAQPNHKGRKRCRRNQNKAQKALKALQSISTLFAEPQHSPLATMQSKHSRNRRKYRRKKKLRAQISGDVSAVDSPAPLSNGRHKRRRRRRVNRKEVAVLSHHIFTKGEWRQARLRSHPRVDLVINSEDAQEHNANIQGLADSGVQSDVWSLEAYLNSGLSRDDLRPVSLNLNAANKSPIHIDGAFFSKISGKSADFRRRVLQNGRCVGFFEWRLKIVDFSVTTILPIYPGKLFY